MSESFAQIKLQVLEQRIEALQEEYLAVNAQVNRIMDEKLRIRLQRTTAHLETEIHSVKAEMAKHFVSYPELQIETTVPHKLQTLQHQVTELNHYVESTVLRLYLSVAGDDQLEIRGLTVPGGGQPKVTAVLPYTESQLSAVLKALDVGEYIADRFQKHEQVLKDIGLLKKTRFVQNFHEQIGVTLNQTLFQKAIGTEYEIARRSGKAILCHLEFDPEATHLAQYPWELLHDGRSFLIPMRDGLELTRYIRFGAPPTPLETSLPLRILFVCPRPEGETAVTRQFTAILTGLQTLKEAGRVSWRQLEPPTWTALENLLYRESFDIIHFDGHGAYARICPDCGLAHIPTAQTCTEGACAADLQHVVPQGYLHFETANGDLDPVNVADMKQVLANSNTRLAFLSACGSGVVDGISVFNGIAPALIQIGVPAVVAIQAAPPDASSLKFVRRFYESLAHGKRISTAVNDGRLAIFRPEQGEPISWFMPVVYLRSSDQTYGQLFEMK